MKFWGVFQFKIKMCREAFKIILKVASYLRDPVENGMFTLK